MKPRIRLIEEPCDKAKEILIEVFTLHYDDMFECDAVWTGLTPVEHDVVFCPCTGVDHVTAKHIIYLDDEWKRGEGIAVTSTAEHTWSLILQLAKLNKMQLSGKRIGIIGYGRIGKQVAKYAKAFGMGVGFVDKNDDWTDGIGKYDIITLHIPLNEDTKGIFNKQMFDLLKPNCMLINTSRAEIVEESKLLYALNCDGLGGYANDFNVLPNHPKVITTRHIGGNCHDAREMTDIYIAKCAIKYWKERAMTP